VDAGLSHLKSILGLDESVVGIDGCLSLDLKIVLDDIDGVRQTLLLLLGGLEGLGSLLSAGLRHADLTITLGSLLGALGLEESVLCSLFFLGCTDHLIVEPVLLALLGGLLSLECCFRGGGFGAGTGLLLRGGDAELFGGFLLALSLCEGGCLGVGALLDSLLFTLLLGLHGAGESLKLHLDRVGDGLLLGSSISLSLLDLSLSQGHSEGGIGSLLGDVLGGGGGSRLSSLRCSQLSLCTLTRNLLLGQLSLHLSHLALVLGGLELQGSSDLVLDGLGFLELGSINLIGGQRLGVLAEGGLGGKELRSGSLVVDHGIFLRLLGLTENRLHG
jgi:hypothetical protein